MKKTIRSTLSLLLLMGILGNCFLTARAEGISPRFTGISIISSTLNISSAGGAKCNGTATTRSGYTVDLKVELKRDGSTIKTWTSSGSGTVSAGGTYYVTSGHEYVVTTTATVYNSSGKIVETPSQDSATKSY